MNCPPIEYCRTEDDVSIAYWTLGSGPPIFIAEAPELSHLALEWEVPALRRFYEMLARDLRVVRHNPRASGLSANAQDVSIEAYNLDCRAVLAALCIKTVPLLSLGMGVHMAANFAARYPEQASALLSLLPQIDIDSISQVTATVDRLVPQRRADLWASWCDPERTDPPEHFVRLMNNSEAPENRSRHVNAIAHHDARGTLRTIHAPTLVVHWDNDLWSTGPELARLIPNARLVVREGRGYPWYDPDPEGLHALIRDFVLEHAEPPAPAPLTPVASARATPPTSHHANSRCCA